MNTVFAWAFHRYPINTWDSVRHDCYSDDAEKAILGGFISHGHKLVRVARKVTRPEEFMSRKNRNVWQLLAGLPLENTNQTFSLIGHSRGEVAGLLLASKLQSLWYNVYLFSDDYNNLMTHERLMWELARIVHACYVLREKAKSVEDNIMVMDAMSDDSDAVAVWDLARIGIKYY